MSPALAGDAARRRFAASRVARLATVSASGVPHLVPCTFALDGDSIYVAVDHKPKTTTNLKRLRNIAANPHVAVLADYYDDDWALLWWVRADGVAAVLDEPAAMSRPVLLLAEKYSQYADQPPAGPVIAISVTAWSGWSAS
ncbi:MAG TPA: TIGR03668 family PPOX class F420-dependent oxidoreductase [Streptosporangiaceae bacterium]|nr:TIGR03668 family PPOX class F420-dependent oxidoreductase [Streptosporangiaceae bacterium]